jgi:uncharacterized SAM-binding protein YcdF (DUF218 family)
MSDEKKCLGLLRRRQCLVPTWRGWLLFVLVCALFAFFVFREAQPFLAMDDPQPGGVLVVEGWAPDYALKAAIEEFHRGHYAKLYVTGGPLEKGEPLSDYKTIAELGAAVLLKLGMTTNEVQAVPATIVMRDRTYNSALFLRKWLLDHHETPARFNLLTVGAHARRSRLLFQKALGKEAIVGVVALEEDGYDPKHWWHYSAGVRTITSEAIAYIYARFLFHPEPVPAPQP